MGPIPGERRTFAGDPNPPPSLPPTPEATGFTPKPVDFTQQGLEPSSSAPAELSAKAEAETYPEGRYWLRDEDGGTHKIFLTTPDGENIDFGSTSNPDAWALAKKVGVEDKLGNITLPKEYAESFRKGGIGFLESVEKQYQAGAAQLVRNEWGYKWLRGEVSLEDAVAHGAKTRLGAMKNERPEALWSDVSMGNAVSWANYSVKEAANMLPYMKGAIGANLKAQGITLAIGGPIVVGGVAATAGPMLTIPAAAALVGAGGTALATVMNTAGAVNTFRYTMRMESGGLALDMAEKGFKDDTIKKVAPVAGAVNAALEFASFRFLTAPMKRTFAKKILGSEAVQKVMSNWASNYFKETGAEIGIEVTQELVSQMAQQFSAKIDENPDLMMTKEDMVNGLIDTAIAATAGMALIKLPGVALDYSGAKKTKANAQAVKAERGEALSTASVADLEKDIGIETLDAEALNKGLLSKNPKEFGKKNAENEGVKAALHAKSEALKMKLEAVKESGDLTQAPELVEQIAGVNAVAAGMEEGLTAQKQVEPMAPQKEPQTPAEHIERKYADQKAALIKIQRESKALNKELENVNTEIVRRMEAGRPTVALGKAASKLAAEIQENDVLEAEILMTPMGGEEQTSMLLEEAGAEGIVRAAEIARVERQTEERVVAANEAGRKYGMAYAKREVKRVQRYLHELLKRSDVDPKDYKSFIGRLRSVETVEQLNKIYPEFRDLIFAKEDERRSKAAAASLARLLQSGRTKGKKKPSKIGDPEIQAMVNDTAEVMRMPVYKAAQEIGDSTLRVLDASEGTEDAPYSPEKHAREMNRHRALLYRAGQLSARDEQAFVRDQIAMVSGAKEDFAKRKAAEREAREKLHQDIAFNEVAKGVTPPPSWEKSHVEDKSWVKGFKTPASLDALVSRAMDNFWSLADLLAARSGKKAGTSNIEKMMNLGKAASFREAYIKERVDSIDNLVDSAYGLTGGKAHRGFMRRRIQSGLFRRHTLPEMVNAKGDKVSLQYSRAEAMDFFMKRRDLSLYGNIYDAEASAITPEMQAEIEGLLTDGDIRLAEGLFKEYQNIRKDLNPLYRKTFGVDMPENPYYSPLRVIRQGGAVDEAAESRQISLEGGGTISKKTTAGSWAISRVRHNKPLAKLNAVTLYLEHISSVAHFLAYEEKVREINSLLVDPNFRGAVSGVYGRGILSNMRQMLTTIVEGSHERVLGGLFDSLITNIGVSNVIAKLVAALKQLSTSPSFLIGVPVRDFGKYFKALAEVIANGPDAEWLNADFVKGRGLTQTRELKALAEQARLGRGTFGPDTVAAMGYFISKGDMASIQYAGGALYKYLRSTGVSKEEAIERASDVARKTQSSGATPDLSTLQSAQGAWRVLTIYRNQPMQFVRLEMQAIRSLMREGRMTRAEAIKNIVVLHFICPMVFQAVVDAGWDDEHQLRAAILGSWNELPMIGDAITSLYHIIAQEEGIAFGARDIWESYTKSVTRAIGEVYDAMYTGDMTDWVNAMTLLSDPIFRGLWGMPVKAMANIAEGAGKMARQETPEDFVDGLKQVAGYSRFMVEEQAERE